MPVAWGTVLMGRYWWALLSEGRVNSCIVPLDMHTRGLHAHGTEKLEAIMYDTFGEQITGVKEFLTYICMKNGQEYIGGCI